MKTCEKVLKEIAVSGTDISSESMSHQAECDICSTAFNEAFEMEAFLLSGSELKAPENLKCSILNAAREKSPRWSFLPVLKTSLRAFAVLLIIVSGFWLGLIIANGEQTGHPENNYANDFDVTQDAVYRMNVTPMSPEQLGEVYFTVLEENQNGNR